jgi:hypothetical protein
MLFLRPLPGRNVIQTDALRSGNWNRQQRGIQTLKSRKMKYAKELMLYDSIVTR